MRRGANEKGERSAAQPIPVDAFLHTGLLEDGDGAFSWWFLNTQLLAIFKNVRLRCYLSLFSSGISSFNWRWSGGEYTGFAGKPVTHKLASQPVTQFGNSEQLLNTWDAENKSSELATPSTYYCFSSSICDQCSAGLVEETPSRLNETGKVVIKEKKLHWVIHFCFSLISFWYSGGLAAEA